MLINGLNLTVEFTGGTNLNVSLEKIPIGEFRNTIHNSLNQKIDYKDIDLLTLFEEDEGTDSVVMIGEIGGTSEEEAAEFISSSMSKPVVGYIAGETAPPEKKMGHAGAIVSGDKGTAKAKIEALTKVGVTVVKDPTEIGIALRSLL